MRVYSRRRIRNSTWDNHSQANNSRTTRTTLRSHSIPLLQFSRCPECHSLLLVVRRATACPSVIMGFHLLLDVSLLAQALQHLAYLLPVVHGSQSPAYFSLKIEYNQYPRQEAVSRPTYLGHSRSEYDDTHDSLASCLPYTLHRPAIKVQPPSGEYTDNASIPVLCCHRPRP